MSELPAPSLIEELENRQDEALQALTELEKRIELVLAEFTGGLKSTGKQKTPTAPAEEVVTTLSLHEPEEQAQPSAA